MRSVRLQKNLYDWEWHLDELRPGVSVFKSLNQVYPRIIGGCVYSSWNTASHTTPSFFKGHSLFFEDSQVLRLFVLAFCPMIYFVVPLSTEAISLLLPPVTEAEFRNYVTFPWLASRNSFRSAFEQTTLPNSVNKILITRVIKLFKIQKPFKLALLRIISTPLEVSKTKHWKKNLPGSDLGIRQYHRYSICRHKHV